MASAADQRPGAVAEPSAGEPGPAVGLGQIGRAFPPELTVPIYEDSDYRDPRAMDARVTKALGAWRALDEAGSADGAYALGVLLMQGGNFQDALAVLKRADERGSAGAAYLIGCELAVKDEKAGEEAWRRADARGSAAAAEQLANLAFRRGQTEEERAFRERGLERALAGDAAGSADAACQLGRHYAATCAAGSEPAFARADQRGSAEGALWLSQLLLERGELEAAQSVAERATIRGSARGALVLAQILWERGNRKRAKTMWATAYAMARRQRDYQALALSRKKLFPPLHQWLRENVRFDITVAIILAAVCLTAGWRWAAAVTTLLAAMIPLRWGVDIGLPVTVQSDDEMKTGGLPALVAGGLTIFGGIAALPPNARPPGKQRLATRRDVRYFRVLKLLVSGLFVVLAAWLARYIGTMTLWRIARGTLGAAVFVGAAFIAPTAVARPDPPPKAAPSGDDGIRIGASVSFDTFFWFTLKLTVADPRLTELIVHTRSWLRAEPPLTQRLRLEARRAVSLLGWLGGVLFGAAFFIWAVAPHAAFLSMPIADAASVIAGAALAVSVSVAALHLFFGAVCRAPLLILATLGPLLGGAAVIGLAAVFGLLGDWLTAWHDITRAL